MGLLFKEFLKFLRLINNRKARVDYVVTKTKQLFRFSANVENKCKRMVGWLVVLFYEVSIFFRSFNVELKF